jgi:trigger factor
VKTDVEELSPTRVKLNIEVPFEELKPNLERAYREVAKQVRVPGFRPGRVPPRIIDQRFGRGAVLEQAVNDAVPQFYGQALADNDVYALGQPDLEITGLDDGKQLSFTAEVDVRPRFEVPDVDGMPVTVEDAVVTPDDVEEYLGGLRERFASLKAVDRPAAEGDYVSIDLSATVDGLEVDDARASGLSYRIGDDTLVDGLDAALAGMTAGESATFSTELAGGEHAGEQAVVTVTTHSVKVKELPELDDEFAQSASEFDTIGEWRAGTRAQLERMKRLHQAGQARDAALEALLGKVDIPLPGAVVTAEVERRNQSLDDQLERIGASRAAYLESVGKSADELATEMERDARRAIRANFVLDQFALQEKIGVDDAELTSFVVQQAQRMGVSPDQLAAHLRDTNQIGSAVGDVLRAKALDLLVKRVAVKDSEGREVDLAALAESGAAADEQAANQETANQETADEPAVDEPAAAELSGEADPVATEPGTPAAQATEGDADEADGVGAQA